GNSEVGHMSIGCGSIIRQDLVRIDDAIANGEFFTNSALCSAIEEAKQAGRPIHLLGLVSDGGVHSHTNHLLALIEMCKRSEIKPVVHMITDGRDTAPRSAHQFVDKISDALEDAGGAIATICGRYYAMDRDNRWDRIKVSWDLLIKGIGRKAANAEEAIDTAYEDDEGDEFIQPTLLEGGELIQQDDNVIFFNFRNDRPRQLTAALTKFGFDHFDRAEFESAAVTCLTEYDPQLLLPIGFAPERPMVTLAQIISQAGIKQFHCSETEKYAHVTFFFNGGREESFAGEDRVMVPSPDVSTYDLQPEMSATEVADNVIKALRADEYGFIVVNFPNGDMVGHTAKREAVIKAVEALDKEVGRVLDVANEENFSVILTSDHGNCDEMVDPVTWEPHTQHTLYPVPCVIMDEISWHLRTGAGLSNIAPTVLQMMGLQQPAAMTGKSILLEPHPVARKR
ncbi:MAG: 2,3-bisphosphoglycerate-independent phosphoglycerate mutase, partial [Gammaproteobacteria bacterium]|nr:2,3-bisphosphoglycerate-independent phosphoglycerate mutase [Gammaproteobacteria bacterium]